MSVDPAVQHEIRNAILNYKGLRKQLVKLLYTQASIILSMDKQLIRIERSLGNPVKLPLWQRIKELFRGI